MTGSMLAPALSKYPLTATQGRFNLFVEDPKNPSIKKMKYEALLTSREGDYFFFKGYKHIENDKGIDVWLDTTTLFITVYKGKSDQNEIIGKGKLKIEIIDFMKQLTTMKPINSNSGASGIKSVATFGQYFAGNVWDSYVKGNLNT